MRRANNKAGDESDGDKSMWGAMKRGVGRVSECVNYGQESCQSHSHALTLG